MRFIQDQDVRLKSSNRATHLFRLCEFVITVDQDLSFYRAPLIELALPVNLGDSWADYNNFLQAKLIAGRDDLDSLA